MLRRVLGLSSLLVPLLALGLLKFGTLGLPLALVGFVKLYPAAVNFTLLGTFGRSLWRPPSMVERIARLREPELGPRAVRYTRSVTMVWCGFFLLNGLTALVTALWCSDAVWALYNGVIAYGLIGSLFAGEWLVRQSVKRRPD